MKAVRTEPKAEIPPRPKDASEDQIDLSKHYNISLKEMIHDKPGNDLNEFPESIQRFEGIKYDARGIIQLASSISEEKCHIIFPPSVEGIAMHKKAKALSFIQSSAWDSKKGTVVAHYIVNYSDGSHVEIPVKYQVHLEDWWKMPESIIPSECEIAWEGENERTKSMNFQLQLFKYTWENPFPLKEIETLDLVSELERSSLMLYAITVIPE